ncbi:MAG: S8 family serine peptidase [Promethearchaeota archaeon]
MIKGFFKRSHVIFIGISLFLLIVLMPIFTNQNTILLPISKKNDINQEQEKNLKLSGDGNELQDVIIYFNNSWYNKSAETEFQFQGGTIINRWNDTFLTVSGFSGKIPANNITHFEGNVSSAGMEEDETIEVQMNYATLQVQAVNSSWHINGLKGDTNCSIAVLDSGISTFHPFFPNGYNPTNFSGNIIEQHDFIDDTPDNALDENGHGTFVSSVIAGTGTEPYNTSNAVRVHIRGNYSHSEVFQEGYTTPGNYSIKIFTFNVSKENSYISINSSWNLHEPGIDKFWIELYKDQERVNYSYNAQENQYYTINHFVGEEGEGIYDLHVKYHKEMLKNPSFSFNMSINYFSEFYVKNYSYFTGIANSTKLISYKIINGTGVGHASDLIEALKHVMLNRTKLHVISVCLSVGNLGEHLISVERVIDDVIENGTLIVIAAGNYGIQGTDIDALNQLAMNKNAIVVGAINDKDQVTSYSSMGTSIEQGVVKPDIVAPGGSVIDGSRLVIGADSITNETVAGYGTSIATAIVSAAINLLIEARWGNWSEWNGMPDLTKWVKVIKGTLLMTASETNLPRENDPKTLIDESDYSPSTYLGFSSGLKDVHEGYGRLNIQAAIDALTKWIHVNESITGNLTSSQEDPLGTHVFARRITLAADNQYLFNLTEISPLHPFQPTDIDIFLFSNETDAHGEPILLASSQKYFGDFDYLYFIPRANETECIITIKAITGASGFNLTISKVSNLYAPYFNITEIEHGDDQVKNATIISYQEYLGNPQDNNYTIDRYLFFINYTDIDTSNVAPQEIYVSIVGKGNYTLYPQGNPLQFNYTKGVTHATAPIRFGVPGNYSYFFYASDGRFKIRYPTQGYLNITIAPPSNAKSFPYSHSFNNGLNEWTHDGTGWGILTQTNENDDRSRIYDGDWKTLYFGKYHDKPELYTYQVVHPSIPYPDGDLISPIFNLTKLSDNIQPFIRFGIRTSISEGDSIQLQMSANWTRWIVLKTFTNEETEWHVIEFNLTEYKDYYIQFRFVSNLDDDDDALNYRGFMLDHVALENYTNEHSPSLSDVGVSPSRGSEFQSYDFMINYYDEDNSYPEYVYLEINGKNYTMYNIYGDWEADSNLIGDKGILFKKSLTLDDISNKSFRIHAFDGKYHVNTEWYNRQDEFIGFINPKPQEFNFAIQGNIVGREYSNDDISDFYVAGTPKPDQATSWLAGDNTWHVGNYSGESAIYGGIGGVFGETYRAYGTNWNAKLITPPLQLYNELDVYLEYDYEISLQQETNLNEDNLDRCIVSISTDYGETWEVLKEYTYQSEDLEGSEKIDLSKYVNDVIMIMFTLKSNDIVTSYGYGWILSNIYIGYERDTDFNAPQIIINNPKTNDIVNSNVTINATITDDKEIDEDRIDIYINKKRIDSALLIFNRSTGILLYQWDTTQLSDGEYTILIVAFDEGNNRAEATVSVQVNNLLINWMKWGPWMITAIGASIISISMVLISKKRNGILYQKLKLIKTGKLRTEKRDKESILKRIKDLSLEEELKRPLTLHCKLCKAWYVSDQFDIMCPVCGHDQIYASYYCLNCGRWYHKEEPREDYFCPKCEDVRLIRLEPIEIQQILEKEGKILREFKSIEKKFSILDF